MKDIYVISDTHFCHENIIDYCDRPFENVDIMNDKMIELWNLKVDSDDIVLHLGDWVLGNTEQQFEIMEQLNGRKYLISGNHDNQTYTKLTERLGFVDVWSELKINNLFFTHSPKMFKETHEKDTNFNIHGHKHNTIKNTTNYIISGKFCVSAELLDYEPMLLKDILENWYLEEQIKEIKSDFLLKG